MSAIAMGAPHDASSCAKSGERAAYCSTLLDKTDSDTADHHGVGKCLYVYMLVSGISRAEYQQTNPLTQNGIR